jgi:hypothetical protein
VVSLPLRPSSSLLEAELISAPVVTRLCNVPSRQMAQFGLSWASNETSPNARTLQDRTFGFAHRYNRTSGRRVTQIVAATLVRMSVAALLDDHAAIGNDGVLPDAASG